MIGSKTPSQTDFGQNVTFRGRVIEKAEAQPSCLQVSLSKPQYPHMNHICGKSNRRAHIKRHISYHYNLRS